MACKGDLSSDTNATFAHYVAFGNSITAGYQSGGINDSTQRQSYAFLVATQLGVPFNVPLLARPGCPPPLINAFSGAVVGGAAAPLCSFLTGPAPPTLNNVAVPGAKIVDLYANSGAGSSPNPLTTIMLGGRTQLQSAREGLATFATVWIGNNEVLGAALSGDAAGATSPATFAARYSAMVDSVATLGLRGALLIGVVNVTRIPALSPGAGYWTAKQQNALPASFTVRDNCAASASGGQGDSALVPFSYGFGDLFQRASGGAAVTLDCAADAAVLSTTEVATLVADVSAYNATVASQAQAHGWIYLDPNPILDSIFAAGEIPRFPNIPPSGLAITQPFGKWLSLDGVHPGALAHQLIANHVIDAINAKYGTRFSHVP